MSAKHLSIQLFKNFVKGLLYGNCGIKPIEIVPAH